MTAATDAIGAYRFNSGLYELQLPSRDCHVALLLAMTNLCLSPFQRQSVACAGAEPGLAVPSPTTLSWKPCDTIHFQFSIFNSHPLIMIYTIIIWYCLQRAGKKPVFHVKHRICVSVPSQPSKSGLLPLLIKKSGSACNSGLRVL